MSDNLISPLPEVEPPCDCPLCPRLAAFREELRAEHPDWWNAPVPHFGDPQAWLGIVGLAPGMWGANRTGRPFTGDHAGILLYETLGKYGLAQGEYRERPDDGLRLTGAVILNSVKCLPPQNKPTPQEIATCRPFYAAALDALPAVRVLVALGQIAHGSAVRTAGGRLSAYKFGHLAEHRLPDGRILIDSYHCSRYNQNTGRLTRTMFEQVFARALTLNAVTVTIRPAVYSDEAFAPMLAQAERADGGFMLRVRDEWLSGFQRFDGPGELLLGAWEGDLLVGVGGVSRDPYDPQPGLGRVRHIYVLQERRREGIGRRLLEALIAAARPNFAVLRLRTGNPAAAALYERLGFTPSNRDDETHRLTLS